MLGSETVRPVDQLGHRRADKYRAAVPKRWANRILALTLADLPVQFPCDGVGQLWRVSQQEATPRIMFRLGDHVGSDEIRPAAVVGDDQDLAGAEEPVHADATGELSLGELRVDVAGAENLIDPGDCRGAERH